MAKIGTKKAAHHDRAVFKKERVSRTVLVLELLSKYTFPYAKITKNTLNVTAEKVRHERAASEM
jgi:hypothetical protein